MNSISLLAVAPAAELAVDPLLSLAVVAGVTLLVLPLFLFVFAFSWRFYTKGGCPGWATCIPFYNIFCRHKIAYGNGWIMLLLLVPVVNVVLALITPFMLSHAYCKGFWFGVGYLFFPPVFDAIIAFGDLYYCGPN